MILRKSRLFIVVVCIITVLAVFSLMIPESTYAESNDKSMTLICTSGDTVLTGMEWKIYKVGQRSVDGKHFVQNEDFSEVRINLQKITPDVINKTAQSFQSFAVADGIQPVQTGITNEYGEVQFTGLSTGLYLISGKLLKIGTECYVPTTTLIEVKEDDTDLRYDAYPKYEYQVMNGQPRAHVVYKEWEGDEEHPDKRPDNVAVDIYRDEEYYDTIILNEENRWRYRWVDSEGSSGWTVMEKDIPECYEMIIEYDNNYRIQNSYDESFTTTKQSGAGTVTTTVTTSVSDGQTSTTTTEDFPVLNDTETIERTADSDISPVTTDVTTVTADTVQSDITTETVSGNIITETTTTAEIGSATVNATTGGNNDNHETTEKTVGSSSGNSVGKTNNTDDNSMKTSQTGLYAVLLSTGGVLFILVILVMKKIKK